MTEKFYREREMNERFCIMCAETIHGENAKYCFTCQPKCIRCGYRATDPTEQYCAQCERIVIREARVAEAEAVQASG